MIKFSGVYKAYKTPTGKRVILDGLDAVLPTHRHIGILGRNGAGKSTLLRMIAGNELPDRGRIERRARLSWPLGFAGGFHNDLTGSENLRFIARIYGADHATVREFVADFAELGDYMDMPVSSYSSGMRAKLAFGISMAIHFDCYIIDEITSVGDAWFRRKCEQAFAARREESGLIMVSHNPDTIRRFCDMGVILENGHLRIFEDMETAIRIYSAG